MMEQDVSDYYRRDAASLYVTSANNLLRILFTNAKPMAHAPK